MNQIAVIIGTILGAAWVVMAPTIHSSLKKRINKLRDVFNKNIAIRAKIDNIIKELLIKFDADRILIFEYSNTDRTINGVPFEFITATYEQTGENLTPISQGFRKVPASQFASILSRLSLSDRFTFAPSVLASKEENYYPELYKIKSNYNIKLTNNLVDGCMSIQFMREKKIFSDVELDYIYMHCYEMYQLMKKLR